MKRTLLSRTVKNTVGVQCILAARDVFQILKMIIRLYAVFVVPLLAFWTRAHKCSQHQQMHLISVKLAFVCKLNAGVVFADVWRQNANAIPYSARVRDFVKPFVACDWAPLFHCGVEF